MNIVNYRGLVFFTIFFHVVSYYCNFCTVLIVHYGNLGACRMYVGWR